MRTACLTAVLLSIGCTSGLEREARCLADLTPTVLQAETEWARLQAVWRTASSPIVLQHARDAEADPGHRDRLHGPSSDIAAARARYQSTLDWYDRIYQRVQTRLEERQMLTESFWILVTGPGVLFYPIVHWNVRAVLWDGVDPDAPSDPIRRFCETRLMNPDSGTGANEEAAQ